MFDTIIRLNPASCTLWKQARFTPLVLIVVLLLMPLLILLETSQVHTITTNSSITTDAIIDSSATIISYVRVVLVYQGNFLMFFRLYFC